MQDFALYVFRYAPMHVCSACIHVEDKNEAEEQEEEEGEGLEEGGRRRRRM